MPPLLNPVVADLAPSGSDLTVYDEEHTITTGARYRRSSLVSIQTASPSGPGRRLKAIFSALWIANSGYRQLLRGGPSKAP